jgi:hypothetical protein
MSTYEGEHTIFGLLSQANLTQNAGFVLNVNLLDSNTLQGHILKDFIFNKD